MKRILLVAPYFFGYEERIRDEMVRQGWDVFLHSDRPDETSLVKAAVRINYRLIGHYVKKYYNDIVDRYPEDFFEKVIVIRGEAVSTEWIGRVRSRYKGVSMTLYLWDTFFYNKNAMNIYKSFDRVLSFDKKDCKEFDLVYRPLFASGYYLNQKEMEKVYDLSFIGTVYSDRYKVLEKIFEEADKLDLSVYIHAYHPSRLITILRGIVDRRFRLFCNKYITYEKLDHDLTAKIISQSKAIVDINRESQSGLTMRTIEALFVRTKIISTNISLSELEKENPSVFLVVDRNSPRIDEVFLGSDFSRDLDINSYSIEEWAGDVID